MPILVENKDDFTIFDLSLLRKEEGIDASFGTDFYPCAETTFFSPSNQEQYEKATEITCFINVNR